MLEQLSAYFYDPLVFWTAPFVLVAALAAIRRFRDWARRHR